MTADESLQSVIEATTKKLQASPSPELLEVYLRLLERAESGGKVEAEIKSLKDRVHQLESEMGFVKTLRGVKTLAPVGDGRPLR